MKSFALGTTLFVFGVLFGVFAIPLIKTEGSVPPQDVEAAAGAPGEIQIAPAPIAERQKDENLYKLATLLPQNRRAAEMYEELAQRGHLNAQVRIANMYGQGIGVVKDNEKHWYWAKRAADGGDSSAQYAMYQYNSGQFGGALDKPEALKWLMLAAADNANYSAEAEAQKAQSDQSDLAQATKMAKEWEEKRK